MMDGQSHALLDIVENRRLPYLERYFSDVSYSAYQRYPKYSRPKYLFRGKLFN
ncbi:hypothetical protein EfmGK923_23790 [Enterococcus faecium]|nr:hypothetical protein [Enterococcus faecium]BDP92206.1 hypothetical protein EfmGK923_23790 [Enterococcus faecium]